MLRRSLRATVLFFVCSALVPIAVAVTTIATLVFAPLPASIPPPKRTAASQVSRVLDANGNEIGVFRRFEQVIPVGRDDIPENLKKAVIAAEDRNFYRHQGVDLRGSMRALWADIRDQRIVQGGSTITQQYVKQAYTEGERTFVRKVREAVLAGQLDRQLEKDDILFNYLSNIYLGEGAYGVGAASETYFRKPVRDLTLSEAAMIAGLIPAPSRYEPRGNPTLAEQKRQLVLQHMLEEGLISQEEHDDAVRQEVWLAVRGEPRGPATVVHPPQQQYSRFPFFVDYVRRYLIARYGPDMVFGGGLIVQTTLDPDLQTQAETAVQQALSGSAPPLEMSLVAVEPPTGYVKALVGGRQFETSQVNLALGGCPRRPTDPKIKIEVEAACWADDSVEVEGGGLGRQPGSAFKAFVLAAALSKGYSPNKVYRAPGVFTVPGCRPTPRYKCTISNNEGGGGGSATIRRATSASINTVYAQMVRDVGCKETGEMARKLGLTSAWYSPSVHTCSGTYALGVLDVSPLDMAAAYGVFANRGVRVPATPVLIVRDANGKVLEDNSKRKGERVLEEIVADNINDILRGVIASGTATRADIGRPAAGKTGTSQENVNAWFVGYTPTLSTAVWTGFSNDQKTPLLNIQGPYGRVARVFGGTIPAHVWKEFMAVALKDVPVTDFNEPAPIRPIADAHERDLRGGFDPGPRRNPKETEPGGPYVVAPGQPGANPPPPPTTTTTRPPTSTSTTSTTLFGPSP